MNNFVKTTVLGGLIFLTPIVLLAAIVGKGLSLVHGLAKPALQLLPIETVFGAATIHVVSVVLLILLCFLAGLYSRTAGAGRLGNWLEKSLLEKIPTYPLLRAKLRSALQPEQMETLQPVMVRFDDSWQFALLVEQVKPDASLVFLPGAPDAWSGSVCIVSADRVEPLELSVQRVNQLMKRLGEGAARDLSQLRFERREA